MPSIAVGMSPRTSAGHFAMRGEVADIGGRRGLETRFLFHAWRPPHAR